MVSEHEGETLPLQHNTYPHEYGRLHGCSACEAECWCDNVSILLGETTECIFCASLDAGFTETEF
jgi:hypothetical protein